MCDQKCKTCEHCGAPIVEKFAPGDIVVGPAGIGLVPDRTINDELNARFATTLTPCDYSRQIRYILLDCGSSASAPVSKVQKATKIQVWNRVRELEKV